MSRLDNDFYNFTMSQLAWRYYNDVSVKYSFINRSNVSLNQLDPTVLANRLFKIGQERFTDSERAYIKNLQIFDDEFLRWLMDCTYPDVDVWTDRGQLRIEFEGPWAAAMFWETPILYTVNEMYAELNIDHMEAWQNGQRNIAKKVRTLKENPQLRFMEFGSRRRHSQAMQALMMQSLIHEAPWNTMVGTSNMRLGKIFSYPPRGTMAHQLFMVAAALTGSPSMATQEVLHLWEKEWGQVWDGNLLIALTDTYGTDFFLQNMFPEQARKWKGFRQDSGDPFEIGGKFLGFWTFLGIDPREKTIVFSDGLDLDKMIELDRFFGDKTNVVFGWGTNLTNDVGLDPISIVVKPVEADGEPCCKLSDNIAKATGDPVVVAAYKHAVDYETTFMEEPKY